MIVTISISENGTARQLDGHDTLCLIPDGQTYRASHVEPVNALLRAIFHAMRVFGDANVLASVSRRMPCLWRVNLSPVNGPILPEQFRNRAIAIQHEIEWLENNWL
jgi:hypothetical protein